MTRRSRRRCSPDERDRVIAAVAAAGGTQQQVADATGYSLSSIRMHARARRVKFRRARSVLRGPAWCGPEDLDAAIRKAVASDGNSRMVMDETGYSRGAIRGRARELGLAFRRGPPRGTRRPKPVSGRAALDQISMNLRAIQGRLTPEDLAARDEAYRRRSEEAAEQRRRDHVAQAQRRRRRREKPEAESKPARAYGACLARHHVHCKGRMEGKRPCGCRCHKPRHAEWRERRLRAWRDANPEETEERPPRPATDDALMKANRAWKRQQRDLEETREARRKRREGRPRASLASHPISEEDVALISAIADDVMYQWGRPRGVWVEGLGDQAVRELERLSHCTDPRAKADLWWKHEQDFWWAYFPQSRGQQSAYFSARRREFREAGLCTQCGKVEPEEGRSMCERCLAVARQSSRLYQDSAAQRARAVYQQRRSEGLCGPCGAVPETDGAALCDGCREAKRGEGRARPDQAARSRNTYRANRAAGRCGFCGAPPAEGRTICARCREVERRSKERHLRWRRLAYPRLRAVRQRLAGALAARISQLTKDGN